MAVSDLCPTCDGKGWYGEYGHGPNCTSDRCGEGCPIPHMVLCPDCSPRVFACRPCECSGMCDKCRQTGGDGSDARPSGVGGRLNEGLSPIPPSLPVCLCDPDTDAVCDRNCA